MTSEWPQNTVDCRPESAGSLVVWWSGGLALGAAGLRVPVSGKTQGHIIPSGSPSGLVVLTRDGAVYILMRDLLFAPRAAVAERYHRSSFGPPARQLRGDP